MKNCLCCKQREIKPTFSFYCRGCYYYLQRKYSLKNKDYINYLQITYNNIVPVKDYKFKNFTAMHNHFHHNLKVTDKPLAELLEVILFLKVNASCIPME